MVNATIKNLPEEVATILKQAAAAKSRSLNAHMVAILSEAAAESARRKDMKEAMRELAALTATMPPVPQGTAADAVREDRGHRDRQTA